jgi:hypothetical protein
VSDDETAFLLLEVVLPGDEWTEIQPADFTLTDSDEKKAFFVGFVLGDFGGLAQVANSSRVRVRQSLKVVFFFVTRRR